MTDTVSDECKEKYQAPFIQIIGGVTLEDFQNEGNYTKLRNNMINLLKEKHNKFTLVSVTKNQNIKSLSSNDEWAKIKLEEYSKMIGVEHGDVKEDYNVYLYCFDKNK